MNARALLGQLRQLDSPFVDAAAAAALRDADAATQHALVDMLLTRRRSESFAAVIGLYDELTPEIQQRLSPEDPVSLEAVSHVLRGGESRGRINALHILATSRCMRLAYLASDALSDRSTQVRQAAADTLMSLTNDFFAEQSTMLLSLNMAGAAIDGDEFRNQRPAPAAQQAAQQAAQRALEHSAERRRALTAALGAAVERHPVHHQLIALEAAMYFVDDLRGVLFLAHPGRRGPLTHAFLEVLERSHDPRLAGFVLAALEHLELRSSVLKILSTRSDSAFFEALFHERWRLASHGVRRALNGLHGLAWLEHGVAALMALPEDVHAAGVTFLAATGMPDSTFMELLAGLIDFDSPAAMAQAAWVLTRRRSPEATQALEAFADCECADARSMAQFELSRRRTHLNADATAGLEADVGWATCLRQAGLGEDFDSIWSGFERLNADLCARFGSVLLRRLPSFVASLRMKLLTDSTHERIQALTLMARLNIPQAFATELYDLADRGDEIARAQTISLLGRIGDATSRRIIERALEDAAARVRVTAIDALSAVGGDRCAALLTPYMSDDESTVRAAAIRGLLMRRMPEAATVLIRGLADERTDHRLAMLTLAARLNLRALAGPIGRLATDDGDAGVRKRAQRILRGWDMPLPAAGSTTAAGATTGNAMTSSAKAGNATPAGGAASRSAPATAAAVGAKPAAVRAAAPRSAPAQPAPLSEGRA